MASRALVEYRVCGLKAIYPLRARVLRPGRSLSTASFENDQLPETTHFGAFVDGKTVACLTLHIKTNSAQLRGMAVATDFRGQHIGHELQTHVENWCKKQLVTRLWCNARLEAVTFYEKSGWRINGSLFWVSGIGPHYRMEKEIL